MADLDIFKYTLKFIWMERILGRVLQSNSLLKNSLHLEKVVSALSHVGSVKILYLN